MKGDIILQNPTKKISEEGVGKIRAEFEEERKILRHKIALWQGLYISLFVVVFSILLQLIDLLLEWSYVSKIERLILMIGIAGILLMVAGRKYVTLFNLEGKPMMWIHNECLSTLKTEGTGKNKNIKPE